MRLWIIVSAACATIAAHAQSAGYDGSWKLDWATDRGAREASLELKGGAGTFQESAARGRGTKNSTNLCIAREHPVVVDHASDEEILLTVQASRTMADCRDLRLRLHKAGDGKLEGHFGAGDDGRPVTATRR